MNSRACYCPDDGVQPVYLLERGIPLDYCGKCDDCGALGHTRHYPGPVPCTGCWCDDCYAKEAALAAEQVKDWTEEPDVSDE